MNNKPLKIGNWVHCILYGGKDGVIYRIVGEQAPESVASMGGFMMTGGRAEFDIVWENGSVSKGIPECILRGVQWSMREELADAPDAVIGAMLKHAKKEGERRAAEKKAADEKFTAEVEALKTNPEYSNLERTGGSASGGKLVAINLRKELKKLFPKTKFSVKSDFNSVRIRWTDGPLISEVEAVTCKYSGGNFNGMEDIYEHSRSPFTEVFGSAQYIFENRDHSPAALTVAAKYVSKQYGEPMPEIKTSSDGTAYLGNDAEQDFQIKVYDCIEKKSNYADVDLTADGGSFLDNPVAEALTKILTADENCNELFNKLEALKNDGKEGTPEYMNLLRQTVTATRSRLAELKIGGRTL